MTKPRRAWADVSRRGKTRNNGSAGRYDPRPQRSIGPAAQFWFLANKGQRLSDLPAATPKAKQIATRNAAIGGLKQSESRPVARVNRAPAVR